MAPKFLNLELKVNLFLEANTSINIISKILEKSSKSIYNTIQRINKKKKLNIAPRYIIRSFFLYASSLSL